MEISWTSAELKNIDYFVIEKSKNGKYFKPILKVKNSNKHLSSFIEIDNTPYKNQTFYRIRYINTNGNYFYSETINTRNRNIKKHNSIIEGYNQLNVLVILKDNFGGEYYSKLNIKELENELIAETFNNKINSGHYTIIGSDDDNLLGQKIKVINIDQNSAKILSDTLNIKLK